MIKSMRSNSSSTTNIVMNNVPCRLSINELLSLVSIVLELFEQQQHFNICDNSPTKLSELVFVPQIFIYVFKCIY